MSHTWILDVLADLKVYARKNNLTVLAEHLDDARHVAVAELTLPGGPVLLSCDDRKEAMCAGDDAKAGRAF